MPEPGRILIVDDDPDILTAGRLLLRRHFEHVETLNDPTSIPERVGGGQFDAVLLDMNFGPGESSGAQGLEWLARIRELDPDLVVVMITAHGGVDTAVEAMKLGASDFVAKPWQNEKVVATLSAAVELHRRRVENASLRSVNQLLQESAQGQPSPIVGTSGALAGVLSVVERAAPTDANILILGENGTGKELIAREIHRRSARAGQLFLSVDMGSISESLFESELFGHKKGAFTGANADRAGRFQAANGGTLFLDEVGNLPLAQQAKLLRVLEQRHVTPVGSDRSEPVDVRIVAATNVPAAALRDEQRFRPDLLFRLNTVEITVPPLRERTDDIVAIAQHYLRVYGEKYGKPRLSLTHDAKQALTDDPWPDNVRALRHAIERAVILATSDVIQIEDLQLSGPASSGAAGTAIPNVHNLDQMERQTIEKVLRKHGFNISKAARELGLTRASLYRRMEKHGL
ncbi:MAG: sigma-54 dependent transcriptional regulator [Pseudomonadota bacterium]